MRATSEAALAAAADRWESVLDADGGKALAYGQQIFAVVDALDSSGSLRRALTDPSRSGEDKAGLVSGLLRGQVDDAVVDLVSGMARSRWSGGADVATALESIGVQSLLASAQSRGALDNVENELFRFGRTLAATRELRTALASRELPAERRVALVDSLLADKVEPETAQLVRRAAGSRRERSVQVALAHFGDRAAARRERQVAIVTAAAPLTQAQLARLGGILERAYGHEVKINVSVEPSVLGGLRVQVGSEVLDATVLSRLEEARRRFAE